jgi:hypothetical protein
MMTVPRYLAALFMVGSAFVHGAKAQNANSPVQAPANSSPDATGKVVGPDSKPQPGVPIQIIGPQGKTVAFTDAKGTWSLYNLAPGTYEVQPATGTAAGQQPISFTVTGKGIIGNIFGTTQGSTFVASDIKLNQDWKQ